MDGDPPSYVRASLRQEVYTERNYLLELVLTPLQVASIEDAVVRIPLHKEKDIKISP